LTFTRENPASLGWFGLVCMGVDKLLGVFRHLMNGDPELRLHDHAIPAWNTTLRRDPWCPPLFCQVEASGAALPPDRYARQAGLQVSWWSFAERHGPPSLPARWIN